VKDSKAVRSGCRRLGPKDIAGIIGELKDGLRRLYGRRYAGLFLYGSYARSEARAGSDIDVAVVLSGRVSPPREIDVMTDTITDIGLKYRTLVSVYPVSEKSFRTVKSPLLLNVRREGISVG
jgi:hypothetical protein